MRPVVRFSLSQSVFMNLVFIVLMVVGGYSLLSTPVENMPPVDMGQVFIITTYYGASGEDVESLVTSRIEDSIDGMENIEYIQSRSYRNVSIVEVKFLDDTDYDALYDELRFRVINVRGDLPQYTDEPVFFAIDTQVWMPVIAVNITGDLSNRSLSLLADELKLNFMSVPGVRDVQKLGEHEPEFHVSLDPERLRRYGVTFAQAAAAVASANTKIPTGKIESGQSEFMVDSGVRMKRLSDVQEIVVRRDGDGNFVRISDLMTDARLSHREPDILSSVNGKNTMSLLVHKEASGNSIDIVSEVKRMSGSFERSHAADAIELYLTNDSSIEIHDSIRTLGGSLALGMVLVTLVLWYTLGLRSAVLAAIGIPFSFLCTLIFIKAAGQSINTISLFSFVLVSGIIVDDATIILENVYRHLQMGKPLTESIVEGTSEVMLPVITSALTTILAFLPMLMMTGSTGDFFSVIPITVSFALFASLIEALLVLPVHILDWGGTKNIHLVTDEEALGEHLSKGIFAPAWRLYHRTLGVLLENKLKAMAGLLIAFLVSAAVLVLSITGAVPLLKVSFFPGSYFRYHVTLKMPPGTSVERTDEVVRELSRYVEGFGKREALAVLGAAGFFESENYVRYRGHNNGQLVVTLPEESERAFPNNPGNDPLVYLDLVRKRLNDYVAEEIASTGPAPEIQVFPENTGPPIGKPVNVRVTGTSELSVGLASEAILEYLRGDPEFADLVDLELDRAEPQNVVRYAPRQESAYEFGVQPSDITAIVASALNGYRAGTFRTEDDEVDLVVRLARPSDEGNVRGAGIARPEDLLRVPVVEHSSSPLLLGQIVDMAYTTEPSVRTRYNGKPALTISANIRTGSKLSAGRVQMLVSRFAESLPEKYPGVSVAYGGEFETTRRTYSSLSFALITAVLFIYLVLATQFKDYMQPLIIITAILFAVIGVVVGMFLTRSTFTIGSFMAMVGLAGVTVNDSIVLVDFINVRRRMGRTERQAVIEACSIRMRPVIITTVTTILGMLPMAIGIPRKSIAWSPMAMAFVSGLASATLLALLMVPVEYELSEALRRRMRRLFRLKPEEPQQGQAAAD